MIDHHVSQDDLGAIFLKDTVGRGDRHAGRPRRPRAWARRSRPRSPTGLLTAIAMDTGWFRHPNTRPETLRTAAELVEAGAAIDAIYRLLFERNTLGRLKLMGETLVGPADRRRAAGSPTRPSPATTSSAPARSRRTPRTWSTSPSACAGVEVGLLFIEQARGDQAEHPVAERARLRPLAGQLRRRRPPRGGRRDAARARSPRASSACSPPSAQALDA